MDPSRKTISYPRLIGFGFIAGFLSTLTIHQLTLALLWGIGVAPFGPYVMTPMPPLGVPAVISLAFWGGVWGILYAGVQSSFPRGGLYWLAAFLFGAIFPSLVAWMIVLPIKGRPMAAGWDPAVMITGFLINGAWGIGTGLFMKVMAALVPRPRGPWTSRGHGPGMDAGRPAAR